MLPDSLTLLRLLQLADTALPIGATAHSFGMETLVTEGDLDPARLEHFLRGWLEEAGAMEAAHCRAAHRLSSWQEFADEWLRLNAMLEARKPARESRAASATLGRRFLRLVAGLGDWPVLLQAEDASVIAGAPIHHSAAFGLAGGVMGIEEIATAAAFLHQTVASWIGACQRLAPLGQTAASRILWNLKPAICDAASTAREPDDSPAFTPLIDLASMRHPTLAMRLFIS